MGGLSTAFGLTTIALENDQVAINTTANNVANANTPGYTREVAQWQEADPVTIDGTAYGMGATISGIQSQRNLVLEARIHQQTQQQSAASTRQDALDNLETIFNQIATSSSSSGEGGIADAISGFFSSISSLASDPASSSAREGVLSAAQTLADNFNTASAQVQAQQQALSQQTSSDVSQANALLTTIAQLNTQITATSPDADAGTLEDQRQQDILQLSQLIDVSQTTTENNGLTLTTASGALLVAGGNAVQLSVGSSGGVTQISAGGQNITSGITGGSLGGELTVLNQDIPSISTQLDTLANGLATQVNAVLAGGSDANGNPGAPLFSVSNTVAGSAASIAVVMTDPEKLAAAASGAGSGDNTNANALAALGTSNSISGQTPTGYFSSFIAGLGSSTQSVTTQAAALSASLQQLTSQRNSLSGVSQDDEAANLQQYETAYQAASKVFTVLDSLMSDTLNLGIAGASVS